MLSDKKNNNTSVDTIIKDVVNEEKEKLKIYEGKVKQDQNALGDTNCKDFWDMINRVIRLNVPEDGFGYVIYGFKELFKSRDTKEMGVFIFLQKVLDEAVNWNNLLFLTAMFDRSRSKVSDVLGLKHYEL